MSNVQSDWTRHGRCWSNSTREEHSVCKDGSTISNLVLNFTPLPQEALHGDQSDHSVTLNHPSLILIVALLRSKNSFRVMQTNLLNCVLCRQDRSAPPFPPGKAVPCTCPSRRVTRAGTVYDRDDHGISSCAFLSLFRTCSNIRTTRSTRWSRKADPCRFATKSHRHRFLPRPWKNNTDFSHRVHLLEEENLFSKCTKGLISVR